MTLLEVLAEADCFGGLIRILQEVAKTPNQPAKGMMLPMSEEQIMTALGEVIDPEIGINIVDLGLVYGIEDKGNGEVVIEMTLTIPECPLVDQIVANVKQAAESVEGVKQAEVKLVFEPKWTPALISDEAREQIRSRQMSAT